MKLRNVLSLFDGMSCGQIALKEMGATIENYYAAEIDKHAIQQTQLNFQSTIQLGSVTEWRTWNIKWNEVDLLFGGSPCQGFSFSGKQLAFDDPRSALFFVFVEIWQHIKALNPGAKFLLENVKMKHEFEIVISNYMGIAPIEIDSALVSAQQRIRLYWTNIANEKYGLFGDLQCVIPQPKDNGILLKDILENTVAEKYFINDKLISKLIRYDNAERLISIKDKSMSIQAGYEKQGRDNQYIVASRGRNPENLSDRKKGSKLQQILEPRFDGKTNTITSVQKDNYLVTRTVKQINGNTESGGVQPYQQNRIYDITGIAPALHTDTRSHAIMIPGQKEPLKQIGNIYDNEHNSVAGRVYTDQGKSVTLSALGGGGGAKTGLYAIMIPEQLTLRIPEATEKGYTEIRDYRIRRLTPTECARLQTIPSWYQWKCSDTQAYRMLGNGWTVNVIMHILRYYYR